MQVHVWDLRGICSNLFFLYSEGWTFKNKWVRYALHTSMEQDNAYMLAHNCAMKREKKGNEPEKLKRKKMLANS